MKILPAVIDRRPAYLAEPGGDLSLLLAPAGTASVLCHLHERVPLLLSGSLSVLPTFSPTPEYTKRLRQACTLVRDVTPASAVADSLRSSDLADWLFVADACCFPASGIDSRELLAAIAGSRGGAIHVVAMASNPGGTTERVQFDAERRVRGIQRYYDDRTWNFASAVVCSVIHVSALLAIGKPWLAEAATLADLRCALAERGVPTRDVSLACGVIDLQHPQGMLQLNQRLLLESHRGGPAADYARPSVSIDASARLIGPVVLHDSVTIGRDVRIIGPAVIGTGAVIEANATIAQSVVGPGVVVPADGLVVHRAVFGRIDSDASTEDDVHYDDGAELGRLLLGPPASRSEPVHSRYPLGKEVMDRTAALIGLIVLSPLMLLIAVLVKLESSGSVIYRDIRETKDGRPFRCWKFRTMCSDADGRQRELMAENEVDGPQFKIEGDPRITRLGKWLRRVSLDELPQLVNVLRGEMSIVGPRPSPFRENQICVPWREARLSVRAGITGLWQVCREDRTAGDFHQWIHYDVLYVQHMSFMVDLKILIATVLTAGGLGRVSVDRIVPRRTAPLEGAPFHEPEVPSCKTLV